jgi:hypothetical protein
VIEYPLSVIDKKAIHSPNGYSLVIWGRIGGNFFLYYYSMDGVGKESLMDESIKDRYIPYILNELSVYVR